MTPGFKLQAKYIIHAVSPLYMGGGQGEEGKLRSCYRKSLQIAKEHNIKSISFPLISTGGFGYPKEEGMRIAIDEIKAFLSENEMQIYLVGFDTKATLLGEKLYPDLEAYIDHNYVKDKCEEEYADEAKDLLARAGYALSPCDKTDIIFSYFIENEIYDMIELDIQLEEYGLPCIIS